MLRALNVQRPDGSKVQVNCDDIQFIEENGEDKTNIMIRQYGQITVGSPFFDVLNWLDAVYKRKTFQVVEDEKETGKLVTMDDVVSEHLENLAAAAEADEPKEHGTEASRRTRKKMMKPRRPDSEDGKA